MAPNPIMTRWVDEINPDVPLSEYPRPMMVREDWQSLNGLWDWSIQPKDSEEPSSWEGKILVPFPVESALSGVKKSVGSDSLLWYSTEFSVPDTWSGKRILLHFEAVDWETRVWINEEMTGTHKGGYDPFYFDVTDHLVKTGKQHLVLSVFDPTSDGTQPRGKQVNDPHGIWYTPVTGIWQSVWLEPVPDNYIKNLITIPDIDQENITVSVNLENHDEILEIEIDVFQMGKEITSVTGKPGEPLTIPIPSPELWSPDSPFLYDLHAKLKIRDEVVDEVSSYFGMRKINLAKDEQGFTRMFFNNEFVFQNGPLDQGFWPDGIYTAPTDDALKSDIEITKKLGFNMLRKHVKVESRRFYTWCDKLGILVWQDMPSGDKYIGTRDPDISRKPESAFQFEQELTQMILTKFNHPSIIVWVPFNEGWGQYNTAGIVDLIRKLDPTRLINNASGWSDRDVGDILDIHHYPDPRMPEPEENRAIVLGEFGGLGLALADHTWIEENWGYQNMANKEELINRYETFYNQVYDFMDNGLSACVYTQITDVETETNGLLTYDREIVKLDIEVAYAINTNNYVPAPRIHPPGGWFNEKDLVKLDHPDDLVIRYTTDGSEPVESSAEYSGPIELSGEIKLKARAFSENNMSRIVEAAFTETELLRPQYTTRYAERYSAGGDFGLVDGERGTLNQRDGKWQGFEGTDADIILDLGQLKNISNVTVGYLESTENRIFPPLKIIVEVSEDGESFRQTGEIEMEIPLENREVATHSLEVDFYATATRYLRIHVINIGKCPDWHPGAGEKAWIFLDEIIIN